jgi:FkbM family methyltransferase
MLVHKLGAEKIIAVDADARTLRILTRAIAVNKLKNIITIHRAVFDKSNVTLQLLLSTISGRSSVFFEYLNLKNEYGGSSIVKTITLDEITHALKLERIDMVKIDVEGAEYNVLQGANHVINRFRPIFLLEIKSKNQEDIFKFFRANGYKVLGPLTFPENYLFIPEERDYIV